jgi:hypothetical protein
MKRTLCLAFLGLLYCGLSLSAADEAAATSPATAPPLLAPGCAAAAMTPAQPAAVLPADLLVPQPRLTATCPVNVLCRCGQVLTCTSAVGDCQKIPGCSVTCDGNEQVCPPCHGFGCF